MIFFRLDFCLMMSRQRASDYNFFVASFLALQVTLFEKNENIGLSSITNGRVHLYFM